MDDAKPIVVLLIDDSGAELPALMIALELEDPGGERVEVDHVTDVEQALDELAGCPYDLILVAEQVQGIDGVEVIEDILHAGCEVPAVLITRRGDVALQRRALAAGVSDYVERGRYTTDLFERIVRHTRDFNALLELKRQTEACYREAVRRGASGTWSWRLETRCIRFSPAFKAQLGYTDSAMPDTADAWFSRLLPADALRFKEAIRQVLQGERRRLDLELRVQHCDGDWLWMRVDGELSREPGVGPCLVGHQTDVTAERLADMRLEYAANHDPLTGLLRRPAFVERLELRVRERPGPDLAGALCICDVDGLKAINHAHGRGAGDEALLWLAGAVEDSVGDDGVAARLTGDKLAFVLSTPALGEAVAALQRIRAELGREVFVSERGESFTVEATWAVGMRGPAEDADAWLRRVDLGLVEARRRGLSLAALESSDVPRALTQTRKMHRPSPRSRDD